MTAQTRFTITISREQNIPVFEQNEYILELSEGTEPGTVIETVSASDPDVSMGGGGLGEEEDGLKSG